MSLLSDILAWMGQFAISVISSLGYLGLVLLMAMESMVIPLPSELIMPFAGYLAATGEFTFLGVIIASSLGSLIGSLLSYAMGHYGGEPLLRKYGKYIFLNPDDLKKTEQWFSKKGEKTILIGRLIPVVRHLISIPAGIGKVDLKKFCIYTVIGATIWNTILAYLGYVLGKNWDKVKHYAEPFSIIIAILLILGIIYFYIKHLKRNTPSPKGKTKKKKK